MSDRLSDADLIKVCLEGSTDDLTDSVISQIDQRLAESPLLRAAIAESPISSAIEKQLSETGSDLAKQPATSQHSTPKRTGLITIFLAAIAIGAGIFWWSNNRNDRPELAVADRDVPATNVDDNRAEDSSPDSTASDSPSELSKATIADNAAAPAESDSPNTESGETPAVAINSDQPSDTEDDPPSNPDANTPPDKESTPTTVSAEIPKEPTADTSSPWSNELSLENPPRRFDDVAWQVPGEDEPDQFPPHEFQQWFSKIPGKPFQVSEEKSSNRIFSRFSGISKLNAPWVDSAVLRLGLYDTERCSFTVWAGQQGVQLKYCRHRNPNVWGAYSVSRSERDSDGSLPRIERFLTSDCGRWHRSNFGVFDLRWNDGYLRMTRGNVVLLAVPLKEKPDEIILDGKLKFRDVRMFRSDPLPDDVVENSTARTRSNILSSTRPADLDWQTTDVADGAFSKDESTGVVHLATKSETEKRALAFVSVSDSGLSEMIFRVDSIDPGTGIYLGRPNGEQVFRISCVWDTGGNKPSLWFQPAGQHEVELRFDPEGYIVPWTGPGQWIRVVAGYGITTVQAGSDGQHWGWIVDSPSRTDWDRVETVGLFAEPKGDRQIKLSHLSINEFPTLPSLADPGLLSQVQAVSFAPLNVLDVGAWLHKVSRLRPKEVSFTDWRRACAVATLRARPRSALGIFLINGLLADGAFSDQSSHSADPDVAWKLLNEASQLVSPLDYNRAVQFQQLHHELARQQVIKRRDTESETDGNQGEVTERSKTVTGETAARLLSLPMQAQQTLSLTAMAAARLEVIAHLQTDQHDRARQLIDETVFWNSNAHPSRDWWSQVDPLYPTLAWAELRSQGKLDTEKQTARLALPRRWKTTLTPERHPLAQPVSKDAYNVMAEFQAAVDGSAFQDACQVISSAGSANLIGLLPDSLDDQLLVSFPNAVAMAMDRHPQLRQQMNERFGAIGRLRVRQAIENGDYRQVEAATIQFFGTPAAAESDLWLGDRALSAGQFAQARSYFERAIAGFQKNSQIETSEQASAIARLRVVEGMIGERSASTKTVATLRPVSFGSQTLSPEQLDSFVKELTEARSQQNSVNAEQSQETRLPESQFNAPQIPLPVSYKIEKRGMYEGDLGEHAGRSVPVDTDWVSRQLAMTITDNRAYLNNRFQVTCLDLTNGSIKWNQQLGGNHGSAHYWPMLAMRPLVAGNSVYCRRLTKKGTELACFQASDGKILWQEQFEDFLVSDPFLLRGQLHILATNQSSIGPTVLNLLTVHRETGSVLSSMPLLKLFDAWQNSSLICQVAAQDAHFFVSTVGVVACCNSEGQTLWVRRREWTPSKLDSRYRYARSWSPPVIYNGQLIVGQPESPTIDCLDLQTGRLVWQHVEPELRRIISQYESTLLVENREGLKAVSAESGKTIWQHHAADMLDGIAVGPLPGSKPEKRSIERFILTVRHVPNQEGRSITAIPTLVWIDAATGREIARQRFSSLADREARLGPFLMTPDRFFALSGKNRKEGKRDIIEFVPNSDTALPLTINQNRQAAWHPEFLVTTFPDKYLGRPNLIGTTIQRDSRNGLDALCPGWLMVGPPQPGGMGKRDQHRGQKDVLELRIQPRALTPEDKQALASTPVNAIRLVKNAFVPEAGDQTLQFKAGNNSGQSWLLTVDVNGEQIHSVIINDETAPSGWTSIQASLQRWAGQRIQILITCSLKDASKQTSIFLSELNSSMLNRPLPAN